MRCAALTALLVAACVAGCGDPIVVLGDAPGLMRVVLGVGDSIGTRLDTLATRTKLTDAVAVAADDATATLYVADRGSLLQSQGLTRNVGRIFSITTAGRLELLLNQGGCMGAICLERPLAMVVGPDHNLYITDELGSRIFRFVIAARRLEVVAGNGMVSSTADGAVAAGASLARPFGIAVGDDGRIYFSELAGNKVRVIGQDGRLGTVAGTGMAGFAGDGGPASGALLSGPSGIALGAGSLFIADEDNQRVRAVDLGTGIVRTVAGNGDRSFAGDGGPAIQASLSRPRSVAITSDGATLFISDWENDRVRAVNLGSGIIVTFAGTGGQGFSGTRRVAGETALWRPTGIATSSYGFLFIADTGHSVVWRTLLRI